jgi:hypothetical protein
MIDWCAPSALSPSAPPPVDREQYNRFSGMALLYVILFFGLALLAAIFISAERKAIDRKKREKRAEHIRERLRDQV